MARHRPVEEDDSDPDEDEDEDDAPPPRSRPRRAPRRRPPPPARRGGRPSPVRRWSARADPDAEDGAEDEEDETPASKSWRERRRGEHPQVYWRARDSLYFGPLVALAIVVVLVVGMYAYTQNWPPAYVVESPSMQHGPNDVLGVINTGDLVLAEKVPTSSIQTYVWGLSNGYSTYGEYGDVVLYWPDGSGSTPIIHRALAYLTYDPVVNGYNLSVPASLPCGPQPNAVFSTSGSIGPGGPGCGTTGLTGTLALYHIGWANANVTVPLSPAELGAHSGYLTMGDNNFFDTGAVNSGCSSDCQGEPDQVAHLSELVEPSWVLGVARGMLPWFGAIKLVLESNAQYVPSQSWQFLGLTVAGLILLAFGIHYALRAEGIEDPRRRALEDDEEDDDLDEDDDELEATPSGGGRGRRILRSLRPWGRGEDDEDEALEPAPHRAARSKGAGTAKRGALFRRGRPKPAVRRPKRPPARRPSSDDPDR